MPEAKHASQYEGSFVCVSTDSVWIIGLFCFIVGCLCCLCWLRFAPHDKQRQLLNPVYLSHEYSYNIMGFSLFWSHENSHGLRTNHRHIKWGTRLSWLSIYLCIYAFIFAFIFAVTLLHFQVQYCSNQYKYSGTFHWMILVI